MDLAMVFKALGHPTRLRMLELLMTGTHCNCELAAEFDSPLSLISYHMRLLQDAGLVRGERDADDGRWIHYSVDEAAICELNARVGRLLDFSQLGTHVSVCGPQVPACGTRRAEQA